MQIKTILVATDFSDDADAAIETGIELAKTFGAKVELFHAFHVDIPAIYAGFGGDFAKPQDVLEPIRQAAEAAMDQLVERVSSKDVEVQGRVAMDYASRAILDEAERVLADMVVLGTRGLTGLEHLVLGSTAERVIRMAKCPVLTVKKPA
jgi:nucleotide-binding universal stress UspA family protein